MKCKNKTIQEITRMLLNEKDLPKHWWVEIANKVVYIINMTYMRPHSTKKA